MNLETKFVCRITLEKDSVPRCGEFRSRFQEWEKRITFEILGMQMGSWKQIQ